MTILALPASEVQVIDVEPTEADRDWAASQNEDWHVDAPTPEDVLADSTDYAEPWSSWPDWTDERWTLTDAEADAMAADAEAQARMESMGYL